MLKPIQSDFFDDFNKDGEAMLFQSVIDDNMFNSFTSVLTTVDQMFSLRDLLKYYPNAKQFTAMMTTSTLGRVIPDFIEQYGENKNIDLVLSPSHNLFLDGFPEAKMTGVYMDKNGNWKFQINMPI